MGKTIVDHVLLLGVLGCLIAGLFMPTMTIEQFWIFNNTYSIWSGTINMLKTGNYFLFTVIFAFSIILPNIKLMMLYRILLTDMNQEKARKQLHYLSHLGKRSMLDVFVIAFLLMTTKASSIGNIEAHAGCYIFGNSCRAYNVDYTSLRGALCFKVT